MAELGSGDRGLQQAGNCRNSEEERGEQAMGRNPGTGHRLDGNKGCCYYGREKRKNGEARSERRGVDRRQQPWREWRCCCCWGCRTRASPFANVCTENVCCDEKADRAVFET